LGGCHVGDHRVDLAGSEDREESVRGHRVGGVLEQRRIRGLVGERGRVGLRRQLAGVEQQRRTEARASAHGQAIERLGLQLDRGGQQLPYLLHALDRRLGLRRLGVRRAVIAAHRREDGEAREDEPGTPVARSFVDSVRHRVPPDCTGLGARGFVIVP
jgi:hypothetical protein